MRQKRLWMAYVSAFAAVSSTAHVNAQGISPPKFIELAAGTCTASVNGTDVGCTGKAIHTLLSNGHHIFNFATKDISVVGFAGTRVSTLDPKNPMLWVERVYLSDNAYDADGQCSFSTDEHGKRFFKAECKALLRDGRKVSALIDGKSDSPIMEPKKRGK